LRQQVSCLGIHLIICCSLLHPLVT
jgi:hypothetical protein